jgi:hypothetical protein
MCRRYVHTEKVCWMRLDHPERSCLLLSVVMYDTPIIHYTSSPCERRSEVIPTVNCKCSIINHHHTLALSDVCTKSTYYVSILNICSTFRRGS